MVNLRLCETVRPWFQNFRPRLTKIWDPKTQNHQKTRLYNLLQTLPRFWDLAKIFRDPNFLRKHSLPLSVLSEPPTAGLPREFIAPQRSTKHVAKINVNMNILWKMITMILLHLWGDYRCIVGELCEWRFFFHMVRNNRSTLFYKMGLT